METLGTFKLKTDYKAPRVIVTNHIKAPQRVEYRVYKKGQRIIGSVQKTNKKDAFVVVDGGFIIPINILEYTDFASRKSNFTSEESLKITPKNFDSLKQNAVDYSKSFVVGGIVGMCSVFLMESKGWIVEPKTRNKVLGFLIGASLFAYGTHQIKKFKEKNKIVIKNSDNV